MNHLFLDESGECSFSDKSAFKHFLIAIISVDGSEVEIIKKKLKRIFARIIKNGWDKNREIKASVLYHHRKFGEKPIIDILKTLLKIKSLHINYIVVNKDKINNLSFRNAAYGIGYNYFTGVILSELIFISNFHNINLIYDLRNKETHQKRHFKEHLETKIYGMALEKEISIEMQINGLNSDQCYGLMAVDFFSWAIYRKFEFNDDKFYSLIKGRFGRIREWYIN